MAADFVLLAQAGGGSPYGGFLMIGAVFVIMYFLMIRPQQKQMKEHRALISALKKGDEVVTQGGVIGKIAEVRDRDVSLEVATGVKIRVLKTSVSGKVTTVVEPPAAAAEKKEEK